MSAHTVLHQPSQVEKPDNRSLRSHSLVVCDFSSHSTPRRQRIFHATGTPCPSFSSSTGYPIWSPEGEEGAEEQQDEQVDQQNNQQDENLQKREYFHRYGYHLLFHHIQGSRLHALTRLSLAFAAMNAATRQPTPLPQPDSSSTAPRNWSSDCSSSEVKELSVRLGSCHGIAALVKAPPTVRTFPPVVRSVTPSR